MDRATAGLICIIGGLLGCFGAGLLIWAGVSNVDLALEIGFFGGAIGFIGGLLRGTP